MGQGDGSGEAGGKGHGRASGKGEGKMVAAMCCIIVILVILVLALFGLNIAKVVMGAIYIDDCPLERLVPIYLIVSGCTSFFLGGLQQLKPKEGEEDKPMKERINVASIIGLIGSLFTFAWLICGSVWIFGNYSEAIDGCGGSSDCCSTKLMKFALAVTILDWVLIGLILIIVIVACCVMVCTVACMSKVDTS